jgi:1-aminocyclopropane-1-carboxylate deaminase/D-cysteine desulfhydrase-like pyridoxal-dependent ACC family enzyme
MFDAKIHYVESTKWDDWENYGKNLEKELTASGKKVYYMPIGGSSAIGALGYVDAFYEILYDCGKYKINFDYIVHSSTSAGTQTGLIIGKKLTGWKGKIIGIGSAKNQEQLSEEIYKLANETGNFFNINIKYDDIIIDDKYIGEDYGVVTEKGKEAVELFARLEGIFLDYVYSGKAASGLIDYMEKNKFEKDSNILFIHTGGNVHLFKI